MMTHEEIARVVGSLAGTRYRIAGPDEPPNRVPYEMDCQDLVRFIERECFGREVLGLVVPSSRTSELVRFIRDHPDRLRWRISERPEHGGIVEMSHNVEAHHVGVWLDIDGGGILHAFIGGVAFQRPLELQAAGWRRIIYHAWSGDNVPAS